MAAQTPYRHHLFGTCLNFLLQLFVLPLYVSDNSIFDFGFEMSATTRSAIKNYLGIWVNSENNPHFAVLIEGKWGSGKTHFVNEILNDDKFTKKKRIYISLFGITSIQEFERQLFYAAASTTTRLVHQGAGLVGSVLSGAITVGSGGLFSGSADLGKVIEKTATLVENTSDVLNNSLIVIDDLERCGFAKSDVLGIINRQIEHGSARVLLVANANKIKEDQFAEFREKVIGQSFELPADPDTAIETFIESINNEQARDKIKARVDQINELYNLSGHNNLRAVRQFIWQLEALLTVMEPRFLASNELVNSLVKQTFIFFMDFKLNIDDETALLTPTDIATLHDNVKSTSRSFSEWQMNENDPPTPKRKVILKYNLHMGLHTIVTIKQWIAILSSGIIDPVWFNEELAGASEMSGPDTWPSWKRLWDINSWDFSDGSHAEFDNDIKDILAEIEAGNYLDPYIYMHVVGVVLMLSKEGLIANDPTWWVKRFKTYIDDVVYSNFDLAGVKATEGEFDSGFEGLGYACRGDAEFIEILTHLKSIASKWYDEWKAKPVANHLLDLLKTDYYTFLGGLMFMNGRGDQRFLNEAVLQQIEPADFVATWLSLERKVEQMLVDYFKDRYDNKPELLDVEAVWWLAVQDQLSIRIDKEPIAPRAMQLRHLSKNIYETITKRYHARLMRKLFAPINECEPTDLKWTLK